MKEENKTVTRKLVVNFDKTRLHSSITLHMRRMRLPMNMIGTDLLKGVIFAVMRHPEITTDGAVEKAIDASKVPGSNMTLEEGYGYIMDSLEVSGGSDFLYDNRTHEFEEETVRKVIDNFISELTKEFCYGITVITLEKNLKDYRKYTVGGDIVKCMLFKKLYAPQSTFECMLDYAARKVGAEVNDEEKPLTEEAIMTYVGPFVNNSNSDAKKALENLIAKLESIAYNCKA